jgi:hypothetical protein
LNQLSFLDIQKPKPTGEVLRDKGIKKALDHAEEIHDQWQVKALDFLYLYALKHDRFSGEMVRIESKGIVPDPPSLRTWGSILLTGAKRGWIKQVGYIHVDNPKAHKANAAFWESMLCL